MQYLCAMRVVLWHLTNRTMRLMAEFTTRPGSQALSLHPLIASNTDSSSGLYTLLAQRRKELAIRVPRFVYSIW